jgi:hypothetical protein
MPAKAIAVIAGLLLLFFGRKLYWLFVGIIGFYAGLAITARYYHPDSDLILLAVALGVGLIGLLLAIFLQRAAIAVAGFFSGAYLTLALLDRLAMSSPSHDWILYLLGGIFGAILAGLLFDWALIVLSSLSGAVLMVHALPVSKEPALLLLALLLAIGILVQAQMMRRRSRRHQGR